MSSPISPFQPVAALAIAALGLFVPAPAQPAEPADALDLVMRDAPLANVVKEIAARTGYDYIYSPPLPGRVTIAVPARVSAAEAAQILNATLLIKGFVALPIAQGRYKVVRWEKLKSGAPYTEASLDPEREGSVTTRIVLKHADPETVAQALRPLIQSSGEIIAYPPASSLILAGAENRIRRLIEIAQSLDAAQIQQLMVRRIRYRDVTDVQRQLEQLAGGVRGVTPAKAGIEFQANERTNDLLVLAPPAELSRMREWIERIDIPALGEGEVHVVRLFHQEPEPFAALLNGLARSARAPPRGPQGGVNAATLFDRDYNVATHEATHSLVIRADRDSYEVLRRLIAELDREPRMVRIDVNFYEMNTDGRLAFGAGGVIPAIEPKKQDDTGLVFLPNAQLSPNAIPGITQADPALAALGAPLFQIVGETVLIPVLDNGGNPIIDADGQPRVIVAPGLGISLLSQQTDVRIELTNTPSLTIVVGEESEIFVGDNVPIPVGNTNVQDLVNLGPSLRVDIEREDVGTQLKLKPVYNEGGDLRIELSIELSLVRPGGDIETGPILAKRKLESSFAAGFDQRMIIAGLESETQGKARTRVPFLSAIPLIGWAFSAEIETKRRTYSLISLTATLIPTQEEKRTRDVAMARAIEKRHDDFGTLADSGYALRAASYYEREMAEVAERDLPIEDHATRILRRETQDGVRYDLFVLGIDTLPDLARAALELEFAGFAPEIISLADALAAVR